VRADWLRAQDRKRQLIAWALAGLVYLLAGGFVILRSVLGYETLSSGMGTIQIRIGTPEGEDEFSRIIPALSSPAGGEGLSQAASAAGELPAPPAAPAEAAAPAMQPPAAPEKVASVPKAAAQEAPAKTAAKPAPAKTAPATATSAAPAGAAQGSAPAASGTGPAAAAVLTPSETGIPTGSPTGSGSVSLKGSEAGNSFETNFDTGSGKISRSLYVPIYLYMPLPKYLDKTLYDAVPPSKFGMESAEVRKAHIRDLYDLQGTLLKLKQDVPLKDRPAIWVILEDAGYPLARADYKSGRSLRPIVIEFSVGPPAADYASSGAPLLSSSVVSSSGYPEIDEAVLYAFRMAGFSNNSKATVKGRFTYDFRN
jgi:outer membrane biosynthesis protein TonB